jgi:hypothetical protein
MNARLFVTCSLLLMILGRVADTLVTHRFSPDLALEANPLASVWGFGWGTLLGVNLLVVAGVTACSLQWCRRPLRYERCADVRDLWSFASFAAYGRVYTPLAFLRRRLLTPPTNRAHTLHLVGAVMPITIAVMSAVAVVSWEAIYGRHWEGYSWFYAKLWPFFPYGVVVPVVFIATWFFYRHEFERYKAICGVTEGAAAEEIDGGAVAQLVA